MVALYTVWYNFVKQHKSLKGLSPAMAAGISDTLWSMTDLAEMVDAAAEAGQARTLQKEIKTHTKPPKNPFNNVRATCVSHFISVSLKLPCLRLWRSPKGAK